jgi:hypothetical protein
MTLEAIPEKKIFSPISIGILTMLGGPLAAALIMTRNDKALGKIARNKMYLILAVILVFAMAFITILYNHVHFPWYYFAINLILLYWILLQHKKAELISFRDRGGKLHSIVLAIALGFGFLIMTFFIMLFSAFLHDFYTVVISPR